MLFDRMRILWLGFWSSLLGRSEANHQTLVAQGALQAQRQQLARVRDALTNLIFQKKKMQDRLQQVDREVAELKVDLTQAAKEDKDELALHLIAKMESTQEEHQFLRTQVDTLEKEIGIARETEQKLAKDIVQAEQLMGTLTSRYESLKLQRKIQSDLQNVTKALHSGQSNSALVPLSDQIKKMEAEMEAYATRRQDWEKDWEKMRASRVASRHQAALDQLKENLHPQRRIEPVVVQPAQ
jgi:phage shock protein A